MERSDEQGHRNEKSFLHLIWHSVVFCTGFSFYIFAARTIKNQQEMEKRKKTQMSSSPARKSPKLRAWFLLIRRKDTCQSGSWGLKASSLTWSSNSFAGISHYRTFCLVRQPYTNFLLHSALWDCSRRTPPSFHTHSPLFGIYPEPNNGSEKTNPRLSSTLERF